MNIRSQKIDLISLIEKDLGQGKRSGRWTMFHCPHPGHKNGDRNPSLGVTNGDHDRSSYWKCFACGKQGGAIKWLMEYHGMSYQDARCALKLDPSDLNQPKQDLPVQQPVHPPDGIWQARAVQLIERAESCLWNGRGQDALTWLRARGLKDETIRAARLGYIPKNESKTYYVDKAELWGDPRNNSTPVHIHSDSILIPGLIASKVWYLKMRLLNRHDPKDKYRQIRGGESSALYLADLIVNDHPVVFCEGEFDALLLKQEIKDLASVVTLGSATNKLNLVTWGQYLLRPSSFLLAYDIDDAGKSGASELSWLRNPKRLKLYELREGDKDLTDLHKSGGDLQSLIQNALRPASPIKITWPAGSKPATIPERYTRNSDNCIEAFYSPEELELCTKVMRAI
jgi:DNA primase